MPRIGTPVFGPALAGVRSKTTIEPPASSGLSWFWCLVWLVLLVGQAWLTLGLFGDERAWVRLFDDQPIYSGRHPLHFYHGQLGAHAYQRQGSFCCYDPAFQAGYPKTPFFDSGCRLAELFQLVAGNSHSPAGYKVGMAACAALVPVLLAAAALAVGLNGFGVCLATALGQLVWWSHSGQRALATGELDLLMAGLVGLVRLALLVRFDRCPGVLVGLGLAAAGVIGWFCHPGLFAGLFLLDLIYYLSVGARHRLFWHAALWSCLAAGVLVNAFWLVDWGTHCWVCAPLQLRDAVLEHRTLPTVWRASLWGDAVDRGAAIGLFLMALAGIALWNQNKQRPAARLFGLGAVGCFALALAGMFHETASRLGTIKFLAPALLWATLPMAHAVSTTLRCLCGRLGTPACAILVGGLCAFAVGIASPTVAANLVSQLVTVEPLEIGLRPERQAWIDAIVKHTTPTARILWEERPEAAPSLGWTALLPVLTQRAYVGGLDADAGVEHASINLTDRKLAGRLLDDWSDAELETYCRRYNIGWVVCWSEAAQARLRVWNKATSLAKGDDEGAGQLFAIDRPHSFTLIGQARLLRADARSIALADLIPEDGKIVLSFHAQAGLEASTDRVQIEREPDANDPIPFIRLRLSGPLSHVTLAWKNR